MNARFPFVAIGAVILTVLPAVAADNGRVTGTITAKGLRTSADIVVSLQAPGLKVVSPAAPIEMDHKSMLFAPHVLPVVTGTTVRFLNSDAWRNVSPEPPPDLPLNLRALETWALGMALKLAGGNKSRAAQLSDYLTDEVSRTKAEG